jgi:hypothetical protein
MPELGSGLQHSSVIPLGPDLALRNLVLDNIAKLDRELAASGEAASVSVARSIRE